MGADASFVAHLVELLSTVGPARARAMMGGHMFHVGALPVALLYDERLYLKTDAETRQAFIDAGGEPFTYGRRGKRVEFSYWTPPDAALDDPESMLPWARLALDAAKRAQVKKSRSLSRSSRSRSGSGSGSSSKSGSKSKSRSR